MGCWITDAPSPLTARSLSLQFMFHVAMMGAMGIQSNILAWNEQEVEYAKSMIRLYKEIRPTIQEGDLYRLSSLRKNHLAAVQYVDGRAAHSVILAFMQTNCAIDPPGTNIIRWGQPRFSFTLFPKGLIEDVRYRLDGESIVRSGAALMNVGLEVELDGDGGSKLVRIDAVDESDRG
jgi:alpha-galactosidase